MKISSTSGCLSTSVAIATLCMALQAGAQVTTNAVPYVQAFEDETFVDGSNIVASLGWEASDEDAVKAVVTNYAAPSFPLETNHTTFASVLSDVTVHVDGTSYANNTTWVDFLVKPKRWEEESAPAEIPADTQLAVFVDTNGCLNIFHSIVEEYTVVTQVWSVVDAPEFKIDEDEWVRISMNMDYSSPDLISSYFRLLLNGTPVTHTNAHFNPAGDDYHAEGAADDGQLGSWFAMLKTDASQINAISLRGTGMFDDMVVNDSEPVVSNIFYYSISAGTSIEGSGTIEATGNEIIGAGYVKVEPGQDQAFTWTNAYGFIFSSVTIGQGGITNTYSSAGYASGYTFTNVQADGSVLVNFAALQAYTIQASAANGSITPSGAVSAFTGESRAFTWAPTYGYAFTNVTIGENGVTNVYSTAEYASGYTFSNVSANGSIAVNFAALPAVFIEASAVDGSITPSGSVSVPIGDPRAFTWAPSYGFAFSSVIIGENGVTNSFSTAEYASGYTFTNVQVAGSVAVTFTALPRYTIEASAVNGTTDPSGTVSDIVQGESRVFTWTPTVGYRFLNAVIGENGATNTHTTGFETGYTFNNVTSDGSVVVNFEEIPRTPGLRQWLLDTGLGLGFDMDSNENARRAYISSTDPTNSAFQFEVTSVWRTNGTNFVQWRSIYVDTNLPPFGIEAATNLGKPTVYTQVGAYPRVAGVGAQIITNKWSQPAPAYPVYYRVVATNHPGIL